MSSTSHRYAWIALAALLLAACANQMEPAQRSISDIEAALSTAASDAAKYVPDQLTDVRRELGDLKATFDRQDYAAVLKAAPAVMEQAQGLASQAKAKKDELTQALSEEWSGLAARLPGYMTTIQSRIEYLTKKSSRKMAAGIDLDAARGSLSEDSSVWSKAQAAFATGNLGEAVTTAKSLESSLEGLASTLKIELKGPAA
jgi:predicted small secreted protein